MKVIAEAPGKVIITGEHFVVHGATALVAAIDRTTRAEASHSDGFTLETPLGSSRPAYADSLPVEKLVREMYRERSIEPRVHLKLTSRLPTGAGLGSSASTMVATVAAVSRLEGWTLEPASIIETAMAGEKIVHGKPSGIDVAASAIGGVLQFRVGEEPRRVELANPVRLLVAYSGKRRRTGKLIRKVSSMRDVYPHLFEGLCESAALISDLATERLTSGDLVGLGHLMTYNHAVLGMVGASNPVLDRLVDLCLEYGCCGAKLTGAGGGGSVIAVASEGEDEIASKLSSAGFSSFVSAVPSGGVRVWANEQ